MNGATATSGARLSAYRKVRVPYIVAAVAAVIAMVAVTKLFALPSVVDRITVENPTEYDVTIYLTDDNRDGWMAMGIARAETTMTFEQIIDHGDVWIFRFSIQGEDGVEVRLTRSELEDNKWRLPIPERVGETLPSDG